MTLPSARARHGAPSSYSPSPTPPPARVLYVEANEDFTVGGSYQALYDLVRGVDRARVTPVVLFYQDNVFVPRIRALGVEVIVYEAVRAREAAAHRSGKLARKLAIRFVAVRERMRVLRGQRIDLVHLNDSTRIGFDDWLPAAKLLGIPCITHVRGDRDGDPNPIKRLLARGFDRVLPVSDHLREGMLRAGIADRKLVRIHDGIDIRGFTSRVARSREEMRRALDVPSDAVLGVMVGNLREWKGQHVVVEAIARVPAELRSRFVLCMVGSAGRDHAAYEARLRAAIAGAGLERVVRLLGGRDDVPDVLAAADVALHASIIPEPFGLVIVEAMALGVPVIASSEGGPAEILTPDTGLTFDTRDPGALAAHLTRVLESPASLRTLGEAARRRAEAFDVGHTVAAVERTYESLLAGRAARAARERAS